MSLEKEIYEELFELAVKVGVKAKELRAVGRTDDAKRAAALSKMLEIWAEEWK